MIKERAVIVLGILVGLLIVVTNFGYMVYEAGEDFNVMSGNSVKEVVSGYYETSSVNHRIFILFQFFLLIIFVVAIVVIIKKIKKKTYLSKNNFLGKGNLKSRTDLDILHEILKQKGEIEIYDIGKVFNVDSEIALEWAKIMEDGDIAIIDYPRFGKSTLKLVEEVVDEVELKKETVKKKDAGKAGIVVSKKSIERIKKRIKKVRRKVEKRKRKVKKISKKVIKKKTKTSKKLEKKR